MEPQKSEFQKKVHLWMPITKLLLVHPSDFNLSQKDRSSIGKLHEQMYIRDQATAYPLKKKKKKKTTGLTKPRGGVNWCKIKYSKIEF